MPYTQNWGISRNAFQSPLNDNEVDTDPNADKDIIDENNSIAGAYNDLYKSTVFGKAAEAVAGGDANFWQKGLNWINKNTRRHMGIQGMNLLTGDTSQNENLDNRLDAAQDIWTLSSAAAGATGYGEVASVPMDLANMAFSGKRALDHAWDKWGFGDRKDKENLKPGTHLGYAGWHGVETIPALGTIAAVGRVGGKHAPKVMQYGKKLLEKSADKLPSLVQKTLFKGRNLSGGAHGVSQVADMAHVVKSANAQTGFTDKINEVLSTNTKDIPKNILSVPTAITSFGPKVASLLFKPNEEKSEETTQPNEEKSEETTQPSTKKRMTIPSGNPMTIAKKYGL
jgi:hypothetical protein